MVFGTIKATLANKHQGWERLRQGGPCMAVMFGPPVSDPLFHPPSPVIPSPATVCMYCQD